MPTACSRKGYRFVTQGVPIALGKDPRTQWLDRVLRHLAQLDGFDLHASVSVPSYARDHLEQLLRYCARTGVLTPN